MIFRRTTAFAAIPCLIAAAYAQQSTDPVQPAKPQSVVAAKGKSFGTIAATEPKVMAALKAEDTAAAKGLMDKTVTIQGTVFKVFTPSGNHFVILDFAKNYKGAISAIIRDSDFTKFPDLTTLTGKKVLITGKVIDYKGQPEVWVTNFSDLKIIDLKISAP